VSWRGIAPAVLAEAGVDSLEDERRLRAWLRSCVALDDLAIVLARLLDDLDEFDRKQAA
jgi:uncharacterized membrane protein YidH (DUF202 family)